MPLTLFMPHNSIVEHLFQQKQVPFLSAGGIPPQTFILHFVQEEQGLESPVSYSIRAACSLGHTPLPISPVWQNCCGAK